MNILIKPIADIQSRIEDAQAIAGLMLGEKVDAEIQVSYSRDIVRAWDKLNALKHELINVSESLRECEELLSIVGHFDDFIEDSDDLKNEPKSKGTGVSGRKLHLRVSEGMIRQNLLTFTPVMKPKGPFELHGDIDLILNGQLVSSKIIPPGNKLQERGAVGQFYKDMRVQPNDAVVLSQDDGGVWHASLDRGFFKVDRWLSV